MKQRKKLNLAISMVLEGLEQRRLLSGSAVAVELNPMHVPGLVLDDTAGAQQQSDVAFSDGVGVTVWTDDTSGNGVDVMARTFNSDGDWTGDAFTVNTNVSGDQTSPHVAIDSSGNFVVAWNDTSTPHNTIKARQYDDAATALGGEITVNTDSTSDHTSPAIAMAGDGRFVVTWTSDGQDTDGLGIYGQRFSAAGSTAGGEFAVNTTAAGDQRQSAVAMDAAGEFVVSWTSDDTDGDGIWMQAFDNTGVAQGTETQVNSTDTGDQNQPAVVTNAAGAFVVGWTSDGQDGAGEGVYFQRFSALSVAQSTETQVNTTTSGDQNMPQIKMNSAGDFVVSFVDQSGAPRIVGRYFDSSGTALSGEGEITDSVVTSYRPSVAVVSDTRFVISSTLNNGTNNDVRTDMFNTSVHVTADSSGSVITLSDNSGHLRVDMDGNTTNIAIDAESLVIDGSGAADNITLNDGLPPSLLSFTINGLAGDDSISGSDASETINGGAGNDQIDGNNGDDSISGGDGDDVINSGDGNDRVDPGIGDDVLNGGDGNDVLTYQTRNDDLIIRLDGLDSGGLNEVDISTNFENAVGGTGNDLIVGNDDDNILGGFDGNDTLDGGAGNDTIFGDNGTDSASYESHNTPVTASLITNHGGSTGETDNYDSVEGLIGGSAADSLTGDDNDNTLDGGDGNDTLDGALGSDNLIGNDGTDTVTYASRTADLTIRLSGLAESGDVGENDTIDSTVENAISGSGNDIMVGNASANSMRGGAGNDSLDGQDGNDSLYGDDGRDRLIGRLGNDYLEGDNGPDTLYGQDGDDFLFGGSGSDFLDAAAGNDRLKGGTHNDKLYGGDGNDVVYGDPGNDLIDAGTGDDYALGGVGHDTINAGTGNDKIYGESGNDVINGGTGGDRVDGGAGTDSSVADPLDRLFFIENIV